MLGCRYLLCSFALSIAVSPAQIKPERTKGTNMPSPNISHFLFRNFFEYSGYFVLHGGNLAVHDKEPGNYDPPKIQQFIARLHDGSVHPKN